MTDPPAGHGERPEADSADSEQMMCTLGELVASAAVFEMSLRATFCALMGSVYASVIVGNWQAGQTIQYCNAIVKRHQSIGTLERDRFLTLLAHAKTTSEDRNRAVHDYWAYDIDGASVQVQRTRKDVTESSRQVTVDGLQKIRLDLEETAMGLLAAILDAFGLEGLAFETKLRVDDTFAGMSPEQVREAVQVYKAGRIPRI